MLIVDFNVENICIGHTDRQTDRHLIDYVDINNLIPNILAMV